MQVIKPKNWIKAKIRDLFAFLLLGYFLFCFSFCYPLWRGLNFISFLGRNICLLSKFVFLFFIFFFFYFYWEVDIVWKFFFIFNGHETRIFFIIWQEQSCDPGSFYNRRAHQCQCVIGQCQQRLLSPVQRKLYRALITYYCMVIKMSKI